MPEEGSKLFAELRERRERQLIGLKTAFERSFEEYRVKSGEYPSFETDQDVDRYLAARRQLLESVQRLDMVLKDVARVAKEVLDELKNKRSPVE